MLEKILKKLHSKNGLTGADVVASISIIVITVGIVVSIYINATNKSNEGIRYSAATRIGTQIIENVQAMTYEEMESVIAVNDSSEIGETGTVLNDGEDGITKGKYSVNVPAGYSANVSYVSNQSMDIVSDVTVEVSYRISTSIKTITLYTVKQRELLNETNEPDLYLIDGYRNDSSKFYPAKTNDLKYIVTSNTDSDWYNYDENKLAVCIYSATDLNVGENINVADEENIYYWIPRYVIDSSDSKTLYYCYGTSDYKIEYTSIEVNDGENLYGYMVSGASNSVSEADYSSSLCPFESGDGLSGMWVRKSSMEYTNYIEAVNNSKK